MTSSSTEYYVYGPTGLIAFINGGATYFVLKDHLPSKIFYMSGWRKALMGSTQVVLNNSNSPQFPPKSGGISWRLRRHSTWYSYTPYGGTWQSTVSGGAGVAYEFTGQELEQGGDLYNFRAREYDPALGIFYASDPAGQDFSPYMYVGGNPVVFVDRNGRWFGLDDLAAALIGGIVNVATHLHAVHGFWSALGYFGVGAASGDLALYGPAGWAASGAVLGAGDAVLSGAGGWNIAEQAGIGALSSFAGGAAGQEFAQALGGLTVNGFNITSSVFKGTIGGLLGGSGGGFVGGFASGYLESGGNLQFALHTGLSGLEFGAPLGTISGTFAGYQYAKENNIDPLTGQPVQANSNLTTLYRAVSQNELNDINNTGQFNNPYGTETKYFSTTLQGASYEAKALYNLPPSQGPYTIVQTQIPSGILPIETYDVFVPTMVVPSEYLQLLNPPEVLNYILIHNR